MWLSEEFVYWAPLAKTENPRKPTSRDSVPGREGMRQLLLWRGRRPETEFPDPVFHETEP